MTEASGDDEEDVVLGWNDSPVAGDRVDVHMGPIIAGDPVGARVEVTGDGVHAYDATGTETASIAGEGGEFVGGEFRTSDALPGQVTLSDTANQGTPGIAVEPDDSTGYDVLPSIGPGPDHMRISGGVSTEGALAGAQFSANGTNIYHNGPGANGTGSWATVGEGEAGLTYRPDRANASHESAIRARANDAVVYSEGPSGSGFIYAAPDGAYLAHVGPGDAMARSESRAHAGPEYLMLERKIPGVLDRHRLRLDDDGVWVQTVFGANSVSYNLLETAQDSGWIPLAPNTGFTATSLAYRNKGGVIYFHGYVEGTFTANAWTPVFSVPTEARPMYATFANEAGSGEAGVEIRMDAAGVLSFRTKTTGTKLLRPSALTYPAG